VLDLTSSRVQSLQLGDRFSVQLPSLELKAKVRLLGLEPHEEAGQLDTICSVVEVTP